MKSFKIIFSSLMVILCFESCQKVIKIKPNSKSPEIVVEGEVTDDPTKPQTVRLSKTGNLDASNDFQQISGALVTIADNAGNNVTLNEVSPGVYQNSNLQGVSGRTYFLNVSYDGKNYSASSTMPPKVSLDTVNVKVPDSGGNSGRTVVPVFTDPIGKGNYYRVKLKKNGIYSKTIFLFDDALLDGGTNDRALLDFDVKLEKDDSVDLEMMCIDKATHFYFFSLSQNGIGPGSTATPANPVSNIQGGSLGYFSAHTLQRKSIIVP